MPYADPERNREYRRQYYAKYRKKPKHTAIMRKYRSRRKVLNAVNYAINREVILEQTRRYRELNAAELKKRRVALKIAVFEAYGGVKCVCGETRLGALTLDHTAQDGADRRRRGEYGGLALYRRLRKLGFPTGYRVRCINCNMIAWLTHRPPQQRLLDLKTHFMALLGGRCQVCGSNDIRILTVHHQHNDGAAHRLKLTGGRRGGCRFYAAVLQVGDVSGLECRCFSCNSVEAWG